MSQELTPVEFQGILSDLEKDLPGQIIEVESLKRLNNMNNYSKVVSDALAVEENKLRLMRLHIAFIKFMLK